MHLLKNVMNIYLNIWKKMSWTFISKMLYSKRDGGNDWADLDLHSMSEFLYAYTFGRWLSELGFCSNLWAPKYKICGYQPFSVFIEFCAMIYFFSWRERIFSIFYAGQLIRDASTGGTFMGCKRACARQVLWWVQLSSRVTPRKGALFCFCLVFLCFLFFLVFLCGAHNVFSSWAQLYFIWKHECASRESIVCASANGNTS